MSNIIQYEGVHIKPDHTVELNKVKTVVTE